VAGLSHIRIIGNGAAVFEMELEVKVSFRTL
jgi:hypothetical protein